MSRKLTKKEFVEKAIKKHGEWYDYSKVDYVNNRTKVLIICPDHGGFWQTPHDHLSGCGCPYCANNNIQLTKEEFVEKAIKKYGEWYDYSKVEYVNSKTKILIICPDHGEFWQTPHSHLNGHGCPKCAKRYNYTTPEWVEKSILVHGDWYDYSKVDYVNNYTKVCIICPDHGEFWQRPGHHLKGQGCPYCSGVAKLTKEEFVERSILVHDIFYDYSRVEYVNNRIKVLIICPDHGEFLQTPSDHLMGHGCPFCNKSRLEINVNKILTKQNINFIHGQRPFEWLKNKNPLELDFYLPEYNMGIECQGRQHFESIEYFGGDKGLEYIQQNDLIKKQLCEEHGLKLFYINYNDNVEEKLNEIIEEIKIWQV
jgi:serine protease inhibitor ecotin